jgi:enoyl-CoA hydratase/carnithine racemase
MPVITIDDPADSAVRVLSISRAEKRNALNREVVQGLRRALQDFEASDRHVLVIRAEGDHFCGGADLNDPPADFFRCLPGMGVPVSKPIVCALQGWCVGGGFTLAMMCDLVVCADDARLLFPEAKVGLFTGIAVGLVARIPQKVATEFLMLGEPMAAQRAYEVGMVNRVVPRAELDGAAMAMATQLAGMAPQVLSAIKRWSAATTPKAPAENFQVDAALVSDMLASEDFAEGRAAFREKRAPRFTGQ